MKGNIIAALAFVLACVFVVSTPSITEGDSNMVWAIIIGGIIVSMTVNKKNNE
jgi:hypothetical protein